LLLILACALGSGYPADAKSGPNGTDGDTTEEAKSEGDREELEDALVHSETLVVTASRIEQSIAEAPAAVSVVDVDRLGSAAFDSYADVLRGLPGMNAIQMSARDFNFTTRAATGAAANSQLVLLDGRSVYHDYTGFVLWDYLSVNVREMSQIEVQRGPGSAIWGAHALNGVINLRTKNPRQLEGGEVTLSGGEAGTLGVFARWAQVHDKWSYKLTGSYYQQDAWERDDTLPSGEPLPPGADYRNEGTKQPSFDIRFDYEPDAEQLWSFQSGAASSSGIVHTPIGPATIHDGDYMAYGKVAYMRGSLDASLFVNRFHWDATNFFFSLPHTISNHTIAADVTDRQALGSRHVLVYGGSLRSNHFDVTLAPADDGRDEAGLFLEDQIQLNGKLQLNLGARVDWFDTIGVTVSPRASLILQPHPDHSLRFAYGRAYRPPTLIENHLDVELANAILLDPAAPPFVFTNRALGNDELDEELVDSFEVGYMANLARRATLGITGYHSRKQDLIDLPAATSTCRSTCHRPTRSRPPCAPTPSAGSARSEARSSTTPSGPTSSTRASGGRRSRTPSWTASWASASPAVATRSL
jgi:iron complex outermembrane receptor protein